MRLIRGLHRWPGQTPCVATIGNFDGVHLGHQAMLKQLTNTAKEHNLPSCVVSFEPLPQEFFTTDSPHPRLHGFRDRIENIAAQGVDYLLILTFDKSQAAQTANDFIERVLVDTLNIQHLLIGDDFHFGKGRNGNYSLLEAYASQGQFQLEQYDTITVAEERVSSTRIRQHLSKGELSEAADLLGSDYRISGRVVHGEKVGRQLGFPTANIALNQHKPPLRGVFAVVAHDLNTKLSYAAVANLGERPTVGGRRLLLEVHVLNSDVALYGHHLQIDFLEFLRGEKKFDSLDALKAAISNDSDAASRILNGNKELAYLSNRTN